MATPLNSPGMTAAGLGMATAYDPAAYVPATVAQMPVAPPVVALDPSVVSYGSGVLVYPLYALGVWGVWRLYKGKRDVLTYVLTALGAWELYNHTPSRLVWQRAGF
jgi:hypothetical protein